MASGPNPLAAQLVACLHSARMAHGHVGHGPLLCSLAAHSGGSGPRPRGGPGRSARGGGDFTDAGGGQLRAQSGGARLGRRDSRGGGAYQRGIGWAEGAAETRLNRPSDGSSGNGKRAMALGAHRG
jgi:hypothetical protein